ncbi:hypothetical protein BDU57DRAFT_491836 [Ampelomyces quisqualis]|uniref:NAD-dependent 15-hydroxyprostaglandin dehydrogenase n=1 Tax=Ampelomyces quisqualis TaxID=50730 RepID=A0A6A5QVS2_AMPQU|nr:hypothetical protein BDU57DRAFT_491836 [Ampelomyces quisqualis]
MVARQPGLKNEIEDTTKFDVKGKSAIVTGAGSGINYAFTALLLSRGCSVLLADLTLRPEAQVLLSQYKHGNPRAVFCKTDVTSWRDLSHMFSSAIQEFAKIDILCPGAGIYDPHWSNFWHPPGPESDSQSRDSPSSSRYASLDVNITHPIRSTQLAIAHFLNPPAQTDKAGPRNPKRVVIVSSIAGQNANLLTPLYVASKHAMNGFIRSLAPLEARFGIRVNGVAPGVIKTPLWMDHPEKLSLIDGEKDEWATAEEVAEGMLRCLEDEGLVGGKILEIGKGQTREVEALMDPGPSGRGHTVSKLMDGYEEVYGWLEVEGWGIERETL